MTTSPRSALTLAALATAAIHGLDVVATRPPKVQPAGFDSASLMDGKGRRWVIRAPRDAAAGASLEAEVELLAQLTDAVADRRLGFEIPAPAGFAALTEGGRAMVHPELPGHGMDAEQVSDTLARRIGRALAQIHDLDPALIADAGLPVYEAEAFRTRRLAELDEAARTSHVPTALLRRWEQALEDVRLWRFNATPVHGDLAGEHLLIADDEVCAITDWGNARVADPADDLAWFIAATPQEAGDALLAAYREARGDRADDFLAVRALLSSELALARWLMHGVRVRDNAIIEDAVEMLLDLAEAVADAEPITATPQPSAGVPVAGDDLDAADDLDSVLDDDPDTVHAETGRHEGGHERGASGGAGDTDVTGDLAAVSDGDDGEGSQPGDRDARPGADDDESSDDTTEIETGDILEPDYGHTEARGDDSPTGRIPPTTA